MVWCSPQMCIRDRQGAGNNYGYGDFGAMVQDYYVGSKTVDDLLKTMDDETAKNAIAAGDANWNK